MSAENESKQNPEDAKRVGSSDASHPPQPIQNEEPHARSAQAQRDEEIAAIQLHSRHQPPGIQKPPEVPPAPPGKALLMVAVVLLVLLVAGGLTLWDHVGHERALAKETERETVPTVAVVHPLAEKPDEDLVLPGSLLAYEESPIYARTNGYLVRWYKDIGSRVTKGELLAKIDTPEVDQELNQARAARLQILAQMDLAKISADRWENLRKTDSVSAQEAD
jgi:multidrug efflux system membrane fusion protein